MMEIIPVVGGRKVLGPTTIRLPIKTLRQSWKDLRITASSKIFHSVCPDLVPLQRWYPDNDVVFAESTPKQWN